MLQRGPSQKIILEKIDARLDREKEHHWIFGEFAAFSGTVPAGHFADFIGTLTRNGINGSPGLETDCDVSSKIPDLDEEYFEWIDVLESVYFATQTYRVAEFGAGFGRWAARAFVAARRKGMRDIKAVLVDAEPQHAVWAAEHMLLNGASRSEFALYEAALSGKREKIMFAVDAPPGHVPEGVRWYGQTALSGNLVDATNSPTREYFGKPVFGLPGQWGAIKVDCLLPSDVLEGSEIYDLVDMDIQGAEADVVECELQYLNRHVRRLHIGTHSHIVEERIRKTLSDSDWLCLRDFPCDTKAPTPFGVVDFQDGVQTWINPRLHGDVPLRMRLKLGWRRLRGDRPEIHSGSTTGEVSVRNQDYLDRLSVTDSAERKGNVIRANPNANQFVVYGPYLRIPAGRYRLEFTLRFENSRDNADSRTLALEAVTRDHFLARREIRAGDVDAGPVVFVLEFEVDDQAIGKDGTAMEFRIWSEAGLKFQVEAVRLY